MTVSDLPDGDGVDAATPLVSARAPEGRAAELAAHRLSATVYRHHIRRSLRETAL
ncbi:hypothetical protein [Nocardiopsis sp. MG754419]|uniref:hypothetical protein n=1 Tax=Nocardiopsis sp. MG754419 TaxID=2259865 RepID=UPI001BACF21A|nr:hypothetical protein [Nocardiopsis sp. MG754419]